MTDIPVSGIFPKSRWFLYIKPLGGDWFAVQVSPHSTRIQTWEHVRWLREHGIQVMGLIKVALP